MLKQLYLTHCQCQCCLLLEGDMSKTTEDVLPSLPELRRRNGEQRQRTTTGKRKLVELGQM